MGVSGLKAAHDRGEPLVEFSIVFRDGVDAAAATELINRNFDDLDLYPQPCYGQTQMRVGYATYGALGRVFAWHLKRVPLERYDKARGSWDYSPDTYRWGVTSGPELGQSELGRLIADIGLSQPGGGDYCQWWPTTGPTSEQQTGRPDLCPIEGPPDREGRGAEPAR